MRQQGSCHCGKVRFEADVDVSSGVACNCSICLKRGTVLAFTPEMNFKLLSGENDLTDYQFNKKVIHHTFCSTCGILAFAAGAMPDGTKMRAINLRCVDGIDLDKVKIQAFDGRNH
ncbi:MAG: GFA family protein [Bdellovibrionaceae bacterium]|nr:GFA family protein [Pseudobdellovibrionaceae bacterium]